MAARIRLVSVTVALQTVLDDGETLTPLQLEPITMPAGVWDQFDLAEQIVTLQAQIDAAELEQNDLS